MAILLDSRFFHIAGLALATSIAVAGCLASDVEGAAAGIFACESVDECPDDQICLIGRCEAVDPPVIQVGDPESLSTIFTFDPNAQAPPPATVEVVVSVSGTGLELVGRNSEATVGEGYIEVFVDGELVTTFASGSTAAGLSALVDMPTTPGAHRIAAVARRADGAAYDNEGAMATRVVWIDDGREHVAILRPWPGQKIPLDQTEIDVEVATLNFGMVPAVVTLPEPHGHAHLHYDTSFPACIEDPRCDQNSLLRLIPPLDAVPSPPGFLERYSDTVVLPAAAEGSDSFTAILRKTNHSVYVSLAGEYVYETIDVERGGRAE